ncbi:hypothetical protein RUL31_10515 [Bacillus atrophaeus]|uniref:hypothetical protein n=1 Tax=Bacillus atrophaeus TaxID=1452 RepID=UPI0028F6EE02|nr:hypothetical protein [Bacillus atrophaeus]WNV81644.1 hypothetical protein RUL31_10515 [Bacillus atrophaeus]
MIKHQYDDGKKHIYVLSYGGGTQSTALLLMALKGEINGVIPDYIIFSSGKASAPMKFSGLSQAGKDGK